MQPEPASIPDPLNTGCRRIVALGCFALTALFALQTAAAGFVIPTFREMYLTFGSPPPGPTRVVFELRMAWIALAVAEVSVSAFLIFRRKPSRWRDTSLAGLALCSCSLSLAIATAMFLPVFQLAAPSGTP